MGRCNSQRAPGLAQVRPDQINQHAKAGTKARPPAASFWFLAEFVIMNKKLSERINEGRAFAERAQALLSATADVGRKRVEEAGRGLAAALERGRQVCGTVRSKMVESANSRRGSAVKTLISLLVVVSGGLTSACSATNDVPEAPGGIVIARSGHQSASRSLPGVVTTTLSENVLLQLAVKGVDTNSLNASSNGNSLELGQQPASTNSVLAKERTPFGPLDITAITRVNQRREYFSDHDKYGGILYRAYRADNPLELLNPFVPREYGRRDTAELLRDPNTGVPSGFSLFSIRFK